MIRWICYVAYIVGWTILYAIAEMSKDTFYLGIIILAAGWLAGERNE